MYFIVFVFHRIYILQKVGNLITEYKIHEGHILFLMAGLEITTNHHCGGEIFQNIFSQIGRYFNP